MSFLDDDAVLMSRYRHGDTDAFALLYHRHKGPLYRYLLRHVRNAGVAADLFQDVWSRVIAARSRYEPRAKFATFLFHIAHNCAMDFFRSNATSRHSLLKGENEGHLHDAEAPEDERPDRIAESDERRSALLAAVYALPREQREAFLLHEETGLTIEEIARVTDVPVETAKSRLRYAVRKLKDSLATSAQADPLPLRVRAF